MLRSSEASLKDIVIAYFGCSQTPKRAPDQEFFSPLRRVQNDQRRLFDDRIVVVEGNDLEPSIAHLQRHRIAFIVDERKHITAV
ncbi:MAG: hypothetical protein DHS20C20_29980 [Ardenticatenaceae bacterium]|nr:MAG: hypothetical protein DHS20C20_29980 [Ardenticatenaceae bacterium]